LESQQSGKSGDIVCRRRRGTRADYQGVATSEMRYKRLEIQQAALRTAVENALNGCGIFASPGQED
jgi:hypothetical protein